MIYLLASILVAGPMARAATTKVNPNYIIDGQTVNQLDAIKTLMRDDRAEVWECRRVALNIKDRSITLTKKK